MKVQLTSISVFALIAMSGGAALAQSDTSESFCDTGYMSADENSDGMVDKQELQKVTEVEFSSLDANDDGMITQAEYLDCRGSWSQMASNTEPMTDDDVSAMDSNQDGSIDQDEYMAKADQEYMARWGETGSDKEVRDADFAPATPENQGGVGPEDTASDGGNQSGGTQGGTSTDTQQTATNSQSGSDQSNTSAQGDSQSNMTAQSGSQTGTSGQGGNETDMSAQSGSGSGDGSQTGASDDQGMQAASGQEGEPHLILRRIIFIPQDAQRSPGEMSRDEVAHRAALRFLLLDANRNRMIDPDEQKGGKADQASMDQQMNEQFDRADADKSGDLSRDEYTADMQSRWEQAQSRGQQSENSSGGDVGAPVVYYRYPHPF